LAPTYPSPSASAKCRKIFVVTADEMCAMWRSWFDLSLTNGTKGFGTRHSLKITI
jgi:hypothetical protein